MKDNKFHSHLNPKLWNRDNKMHPEVSAKLKEIADAFIEFLDIPRKAIKDVVITGSSASYNYTPHSDIDLHILVDKEKVHKNCPIVDDFLISKKSEFNDKHDIYIYGIPVEVYAEDYRNENIHNGLYSLATNAWVDKPKKLVPADNDVAVATKYKELAILAKEVADKDEAVKLIEKIKKMRKAGLAKNGEFSVENLVFKKLRNEGVIEKLMQTKKEGIDRELSLEESLSTLYESLIDDIIVCINEFKEETIEDVGIKRQENYDKARSNVMKMLRTGSPREISKATAQSFAAAKKLDRYNELKRLRDIAKEKEQKEIEDFKKKYSDKEPQTIQQTKQAGEDHSNAQINQGLRNWLEKIYNKNEALGALYESLLDYVEEMLAIDTGISGMMDRQPVPLAGQGQPSYSKQNKNKQKSICNYNYKRVAHKRTKDVQ